MTIQLTADVVRQLLDYDPSTGVLVWRVNRGKLRNVGKQAGCTHNTSTEGYRAHTIGVFGRNYRAHRLAWLHYYGEWPETSLDHINGDPLDNRICNLRECTIPQNLANTTVKKNSLTGTKGVHFDKSRGLYSARIRVGGKRLMLGRYRTQDEAAAAYATAALAAHGEFARVS